MQDWELIGKFIKGEATVEEQLQVEQWLKADAANAALLADIKATWDSAGKINESLTIDKAKAWKSIQQKISEEEKVLPITRKARAYNAWILRVAAVLIVGLFATWFFLKVNNAPQLILVQTAKEKKTIVMPDSTIIYLNENSTLLYPEEFAANQRKVELTGEAFFEVTKNPDKPFIIGNENFNVKVLGTSFNVLAYDADEEATVSVVTGKVAFSDRSGNSVLLIKNETGILNKNKKQLNKFSSSNTNFLAWKNKKLEFNKTSFNDVCAALKKYFAIEIEVKDKNILNCTFTGYFEDPTLQNVLNVLEKTLELKTVIIDKKVEITGKGC